MLSQRLVMLADARDGLPDRTPVIIRDAG